MSNFARALLAILPAWPPLGNRDLPIGRFLRRRGLAPGRRDTLQAEVRCELCDAGNSCRRLLAEGRSAPIAGCPNASLFRDA